MSFEGCIIYSESLTYHANTFVIGSKTYFSISRIYWEGNKRFSFGAHEITVSGKKLSMIDDIVEIPAGWNNELTVDGATYTYKNENRVDYTTAYDELFALASGPYLVFLDKPSTKIIQNEEGVKTIIIARIKFHRFYTPMYSTDKIIFAAMTSGEISVKAVMMTPGKRYITVDGKTFTFVGNTQKSSLNDLLFLIFFSMQKNARTILIKMCQRTP